MTDGKSVFRVGGMTDRILVWEMRVQWRGTSRGRGGRAPT